MQPSGVDPRLPRGNFYGEMLRQHDAAGFSLSESRYPQGSTLPRHFHESPYICFVLRGTYSETYERKVRACKPAMILYHPAGELHAQYFDNTRVDLFRIEVNPARLQLTNYPDLSIDGCDFRDGAPVGLAHRLYQEFREPDEVSPLAIEGLGLELIATIARDSRHRETTSRQLPSWLSRAHEIIKARFLEHLNLSEIAGDVSVHPVTLARAFRSHYHCTVGEMVRRERISFACRELLSSGKTLADVAIAAGFYDQSHFARIFKKTTGITPTQYRANHRSR
ncbi:MAG TPA: AraC family transcriptional regulator [Pyrinomonadaceae bacterium]|nr:AraC family transcriptional regulator [Pyrinomonadaceae bacterium]